MAAILDHRRCCFVGVNRSGSSCGSDGDWQTRLARSSSEIEGQCRDRFGCVRRCFDRSTPVHDSGPPGLERWDRSRKERYQVVIEIHVVALVRDIAWRGDRCGRYALPCRFDLVSYTIKSVASRKIPSISPITEPITIPIKRDFESISFTDFPPLQKVWRTHGSSRFPLDSRHC